MKILLLNPHVDALHGVVQALELRGVSVLYCTDPGEAWQVLNLHGRSIELAIVHRENVMGATDKGLELIAQARKDPMQADLPFVVTSAQWGDAEFAAHQASEMGAHAYLNYPFTAEALLPMLEAIFGQTLSKRPPPPLQPLGQLQQNAQVQQPKQILQPTPLSIPGKPAGVPMAAPSAHVLEDVSVLFENSKVSGTASIVLEAPELPEPNEPSELSAMTKSNVKAREIKAPAPSAAEPSIPDFVMPELVAPTLEDPTVALPSGTSAIDLSALPEIRISAATESPVAEDPHSFEMPAAVELTKGPSLVVESQRLDIPVAKPDSGETPSTAEDLASDNRLIESEMPYLLDAGAGHRIRSSHSGDQQSDAVAIAPFSTPLGDAVVPGGAAHSPDLETLKKYLLLREQDVAALSSQLRSAREQLTAVEDTLKQERAKNIELAHTVQERGRRIEDFEREKALAFQSLQNEIAELRFQAKAKADKARVLEVQVRDAAEEMERLKERVRSDIRKIRVREKELENRLEIMKKDSEALIGARENKIVELKRKLDLLEFNMDLLQDQYAREKESTAKQKERLARALQAVKVAGGLLDPGDSNLVEELARAVSAKDEAS